MIEVQSVQQAEKEDRRQRRIIASLFVIGFLGLGYAIFDYYQLVNREVLPPSLSDVDPVIARWKASGLVETFDVSQRVLVVNDEKWNGKERPEKIGIVTQLARYCADKNKSTTWALTVRGSASTATLGELGPRGIIVN